MEKFFKFLVFALSLCLIKSIPINDDFIDSAEISDMFKIIPSEEVGKMVDKWTSGSEVNPEELGNYLEGDIMMSSDLGRSALTKESSHWQDGIVPYVFHESLTENDKSMINKCFDEYHSKTCIKFVERTSEIDYLVMKSSHSGCWSFVGRKGGAQPLNLQSPACLKISGTICHELMHALGFLHEQSRPDRDDHVKILKENIRPKSYFNFEKAKMSTSTYDVPYDEGSIMHYSSHAFSKNGKPTIEALSRSSKRMGQREGFSDADLERINMRYNCVNKTTSNEV